MNPFVDLDKARQSIETFEGNVADFALPVADELNDPVGISMAILTDAILAKGWESDGFEAKDGFRIYRYKSTES